MSMYVRITRGSVEPARYDEAVAVAQEIARAASRLPGFRSYHVGADRATGQWVAVSEWDSEASARFSREALGEAYTRFLAGARLPWMAALAGTGPGLSPVLAWQSAPTRRRCAARRGDRGRSLGPRVDAARCIRD